MEPRNYTKTSGELIRQARIDKNLSYQDIADKLQMTAEDVEEFEKMEKVPNDEALRKLSGILGINYRELRVCAGYNMMMYYSAYYLPDGTAINIEEILDKIYYREPSILQHLYEAVFEK